VAKKGARVIITLECTEARKEGKSPSRYTTTKNKKTTPDRLELKKYNPFLRRHTVHKEIKYFSKIILPLFKVVRSFLLATYLFNFFQYFPINFS
jgi:large subunit ribosomal protein L33